MNIEPISSAMSYAVSQAAPVAAAAPVVKEAEKPEKNQESSTDAASAQSVFEYVDSTTPAIRQSEEKNGNSEEESGAGSRESQQDNKNNKKKIKSAVEELNKKMMNSEAIFGIHEETQRVTIKIVDKESKEVLKEFPPEKTLDMIARVWEMAGLFVDEKR